MTRAHVLALALLLAGCPRTGADAPAAPTASPPQRASAPAPAPQPGCEAEENCDCPVPGIPERWVLGACMAAEQTDDGLHAGVVACFREAQDRAPQRTLPPCERNAFYKRKACEAVSRSAQETEACVRDPKHFPYPVIGGVGG